MLTFDFERWNDLTGGYKTPLDSRPLLRRLEGQKDAAAAWQELGEELQPPRGTLAMYRMRL